MLWVMRVGIKLVIKEGLRGFLSGKEGHQGEF